MAGGGRRGSYGNTAIRSMRPNAARSLWQYCHNAAEAPARHPRLELSTTVDPIPEILGRAQIWNQVAGALALIIWITHR